MDFGALQLLILDVDGVLTDGSVAAVEQHSVARFHVQDGCAIKVWRRCEGRVAILSGRAEAGVVERAAELGIEWVRLGVAEKQSEYESILKAAGCGDASVVYMGDDLPDLGPMGRCGFPVAVANAVPAIKRAASYVTRRRGGEGAVAEVVELVLRKQKRWNRSLLKQM